MLLFLVSHQVETLLMVLMAGVYSTLSFPEIFIEYLGSSRFPEQRLTREEALRGEKFPEYLNSGC